jgi:glycosyltransferase involved in cell wall biosynthesis
MHSDLNSEANSGNSAPQPLVTVVIPFFNRSNCISRTLQSVLLQCYTNWEALIVDDGSSTEEREQLLALVEQLGDDRFRVLVQAENCGGGAARNVGMLDARGQYIALLDSDDEWEPGKLEAQVRLHASSGDMLVSYTRSVIDFGGARGRQAPMPEHAIGRQSVADYLFYVGGFMPTPSLFGSADVFTKCLFDESLRRHQDYDFLLSLEAFGCQFEMLHEVLVTIHWEDVGTAAGKRFYCPEVSEKFIADRPAMFSRRAAAAFRLNNVFAPRRQEEGLRAACYRGLVRDLFAVDSWKFRIVTMSLLLFNSTLPLRLLRRFLMAGRRAF